MKYLFVTGAPRSGTSALTELLSSHLKISIGMERYKYCYQKKNITRDFFIKENFFNFKDDETNINNKSGKYVDYYKNLEKSYLESSVVGDKYPQMYNQWNPIFNEFKESARFIVIIRDIYSVASSFNARAENPKDKWPAENDYKKAVMIWNQSLVQIESKINQNLFIVRYEDLFSQDQMQNGEIINSMMNYLSLTPDKAFLDKYHSLCSAYEKNIKHKTKLIRNGQNQFISENANFELYEKLLSRQ